MAMMDELIQQISVRTGIPHEQAEKAAHAAIEFLDGRLPPPIGGNLKRVVAGGGEGGGGMPDLGKMAGGLGGLFGGK